MKSILGSFPDVVCVLNLEREILFSNRAADQLLEELKQDAELWSGCVAGAFREDAFLKAFEEAGFHGIQLAARSAMPWRTVAGIEFRSATVLAYKGKQGPSLDRRQALIYRGPFKEVEADDGHHFVRGERTAVCDRTFHLLQREPYAGLFEPVEPLEAVPPEEATPFESGRPARRHPRETKGRTYRLTTQADSSCCDGGSCCQ